MCSGMCTHFHPSTRKNEEYMKHLKEHQYLHTFKRDGIVAVVRSPHAHPIESVHVRITGKVQNVRYLTWATEHAKLMSIDGWIRNVKDGSLEAVFSGKSVSVDKMLDICKTGPSYAQVKQIEAEACDPPRGTGFHILSTHDPMKSPAYNKEHVVRSDGALRLFCMVLYNYYQLL
ncbi:uncharacterized protein [Physcomitrium patens]|uniref:uncharacterized protein isoform X2 n=1 Tax=Physcomitrium patens TaxID=3218 RepID=UPI003CCD58D7